MHTKRDQPLPKQTPIATPPTSKPHENSPPVQPVTLQAEPIQRTAPKGQHLMESVLGSPFGLGELSLAVILVIPLGLMALAT